MVWLVGGLGTNKSEVAARAAQKAGYDVLSCQELARAARATATQVLIDACPAS